jgi:5-methyltetrahydropteroyltriglutamate--homocysteine methyltransferase
LQYAAELINAVVHGIEGIRTGVHVCRGNWSRDEGVLLSGDYTPLVPAFQDMRVDQFVLEYATPRAGDIAVVGKALAQKEIGLGVCNPRTSEVETPESIIERVHEALHFFPPEKIYLNPDCGFGCFAQRCVNDSETAFNKLRSMAAAAQRLRESV